MRETSPVFSLLCYIGQDRRFIPPRNEDARSISTCHRLSPRLPRWLKHSAFLLKRWRPAILMATRIRVYGPARTGSATRPRAGTGSPCTPPWPACSPSTGSPCPTAIRRRSSRSCPAAERSEPTDRRPASRPSRPKGGRFPRTHAGRLSRPGWPTRAFRTRLSPASCGTPAPWPSGCTWCATPQSRPENFAPPSCYCRPSGRKWGCDSKKKREYSLKTLARSGRKSILDYLRPVPPPIHAPSRSRLTGLRTLRQVAGVRLEVRAATSASRNRQPRRSSQKFKFAARRFRMAT